MKNERNPLSASMSRRTALKVMGGFASVAALAACAAPVAAPAPAEGGEAPAEAAGTLSVAHRREYFKEMEDLFAQAVAAWGVENNVEVETTTVAAEAKEDFMPKLLASVQAGNPPDLVYHVRMVLALEAQGALEVVSDTATEMMEQYGDTAFGQYALAHINDEWYGIPYIMSGGGTFGRRSLYEAAGIDPMALPTYDDRRDAAFEINNPEEELYGWGLTVNSGGDATGFIQHVMQCWGGHYTDEAVEEVTFNSPETLAAVEWLADIYTGEKYASMLPPGLMAWNDSSNNEAFLSGTLGYTHNSASIYAKAKADENPIYDDTVIMGTAVGPTGDMLEAGDGGQFLIPLGAANQASAKDLAAYMISPEVFMPMSMVSAGLFLPAYTDYYELPEVVAAFEENPNLATMGKSAQGDHIGASWPADPGPLFDAINAQAVLTDMMAQIVAQGATPDKAVSDAADRILTIGQESGFFV